MSGLDITILGLSIGSSWGNGHATTFRALVGGLHTLGHRVTFLEREVPWYAGAHRDLPNPTTCDLVFYHSVADLESSQLLAIRDADAVIVGSYVPEGIDVIDVVLRRARGVTAFYDIDTPVTLAALDRGEETYVARRQIPGFDAYLSFSGGPILDRLREAFGARHAAPLYCSVDETLYRPSGEKPSFDLGYLGTYSPDRQPTLEALLLEPARRLPDLSFVVAGPQYPAGIEWPDNVTRIEHLPPAEHPAFYGHQRWTLNVTRADMIAAGWSPSVRLFEAAACGTPVVSDAWPGLTDLFPDREAIILAGNTEGVVALLSDMNLEADRQKIAAEARRRVLAGHTGKARAAELVATLAAAGTGTAPPRLVAVG